MAFFRYFIFCLLSSSFGAYASDEPLDLLLKINNKLRLAGIENFQLMTIQKSSSGAEVNIDISTLSLGSDACITKTAQFDFSEGELHEYYEDQLWLGDCKHPDSRNSIRLKSSSDADILIKLMMDANNIFINTDKSKISKYHDKNKLISKYSGKVNKILFINSSSGDDQVTLSFIAYSGCKKIYIDISNKSDGDRHDGVIGLGDEQFDYVN